MDIEAIDQTLDYLYSLQPDTSPLFGMMTAQHMIEHLIIVTSLSTEDRGTILYQPEDRAARWKQHVIYGDAPLEPGFKAPFLPKDALLPLKYDDIPSAIEQLRDTLSRFHHYFVDNQGASLMHPVMGLFNYEEWKIFHRKHFTHHYRQFDLI